MGTEKIPTNQKNMKAIESDVKLNNPLMGTENELYQMLE